MNRTPFLRTLTATTVIAVGLSSVPAISFAAFSDVSGSAHYATAINALQAKGVLQGYSDGTFKPDASIARGEFLKIVLEARGTEIGDAKDCFPDVHAEWFAKYVCAAKTEGIVAGYPADGLFHPEQNISFVEGAKILVNAYKQPVDQTSPDWYEPFARALESSKDIPTTIARLDANLTRGEMAEMMWRLEEGKTDQPTKGYLNVKYPELKVNLASDTPQTATSCTDLRAFVEEAQRTGGNSGFGGGPMMMRGMAEDGAVAAPMANQAKSADHASTTSTDYSQTNVQVAGVDEGDIIKTDGTYLYIVRNNEKSRVTIVQALPANALKEIATIDLQSESGGMMVQEIYVDSGKLVVIGTQTNTSDSHIMPMESDMKMRAMPGSIYYPGWYVQRTQVRVYNVSTASKPVLDRTLSFDGSQISTRRIGTKLYLVLQNGVNWWGGPIPLDAMKMVPQMEDSATGKTTAIAPCDKIAIFPRVPSPQYLTVAVIPTDSKTAEVKSKTMLGNAQNVYSSLNNLYVANTEWNYVWDAANPQSNEKTTVYRFAINDQGVDLQAQGSVPGHILNQFAMDESKNTFRLATTVNPVWSGMSETAVSKSSNNVYVLNTDMAQVGKIENIAPGETIYSARFMGDRAYMVTFKTVDPFFVVDLSDARNPKILGQLKIPGYSNYLEPYDENHVIGFGHEVDASIDADKVHSEDAVYYTAIQGVKVSIFDVTDVSKPTEMFKTIIGDRGTDSPVLTDHHALLFEKDRGLLSFPITVAKIPDGQPKNAEGQIVFQGAYVYSIDLQKGLTLRGTATQYDDPEIYKKTGTYWYDQGSDVQRVVRIGSSLYTVSQNGVRSYGETDVKQQGMMQYTK